MEETLTQRSRRREAAHTAITMLKVAIMKACHENSWKNGAFGNLKYPSSDVDFDLERLEVYWRTTEAERAVFQDTRRKVADLRAYLDGRPTDLSSVDDVGWVQRLKNVFEGKIEHDQRAGEASTREDDGFERQKVYGGSGGPPKD